MLLVRPCLSLSHQFTFPPTRWLWDYHLVGNVSSLLKSSFGFWAHAALDEWYCPDLQEKHSHFSIFADLSADRWPGTILVAQRRVVWQDYGELEDKDWWVVQEKYTRAMRDKLTRHAKNQHNSIQQIWYFLNDLVWDHFTLDHVFYLQHEPNGETFDYLLKKMFS